MDKKQIQKNLYDLEYDEILNNQNIIIILIGTFLVGVILSNLPGNSKITISIFSLLIMIYVKKIFNKKLKEIKLKIKEL